MAAPTTFWVPGVPIPKGSARGFVVNGRAVVTHANAKTKPWEQAIRAEAAAAGLQPSTAPMAVTAEFVMPRPKGHFGTGKNAGRLRETAPAYPTSKPDADKMARTVLDGLTGVAYRDDAQVAELLASKRYADVDEHPGARIEVRELFEPKEAA